MIVQENISLRPFNTFGIEARARFFSEVSTLSELQEALRWPNHPRKLILGGGSNVLITEDLDMLVVKIGIRGISVVGEDDRSVWIRAMAGENWHQFVEWCLERNYGGLENLSLIPGQVGTAPVQNIGAYGVELKDVMAHCEAMTLDTGTLVEFSNSDCRFGYRDSIFKNEYRHRVVITSVVFRLSKPPHPVQAGYQSLQDELARRGVTQPTIHEVADSVTHIRRSKLPDPAEIGNAGSFFKNPVISSRHFDKLQSMFPAIVHYPGEPGMVKLAAGWLIEHCGWKGYREGQAGVHQRQALVLVNHGGASGGEILGLARRIQESVKQRFEVALEPEVRLLSNAAE